jgi:hypothetical protein
MSKGWPKGARFWEAHEIVADAQTAREQFRQRRFGEPMEKYLAAFVELERANRQVIGSLQALVGDPVSPRLIASFVRDQNMCTALRYLGAPPISADDLETLTGATLAWTLIEKDVERASAIRDVIRQILDPKRFPWIYEKRAPTSTERKAAILASTVAASSQRLQTNRRTDDGKATEEAVRGVLIGMGMTPVTLRRIANPMVDVLNIGHFSAGPCVLGEDEADVVIRLYDGRIMALECKASNSEINSRKRINKEIGQNAQNWVGRFGSDLIVPAGAIQGVFKASYIQAAQEIPVVFYWGHRISDLRDFISSTRNS